MGHLLLSCKLRQTTRLSGVSYPQDWLWFPYIGLFIWNHHEFWALGAVFDSFWLTVNSHKVPYFYKLKETCCSRQHCLCPGHIAVLCRRLHCQVISIGTYWVYKVLRNEAELTYSLAVCTPFLLVLTRVWKCPFCLKLMLKKIVMMSLPLLCSLSWNLALLPIQGKECISLSVHTECHHVVCFASWNDSDVKVSVMKKS